MIDFVAVELMSTGWCPLDCSYCYIPKSDMMKDMHKKIKGKMESGEWISNLKEDLGDLKSIGFWGTEPLLIMESIVEHFDELTDTFSKLENINFSTSLCINPEPLVELKRKCDENDIHLGWQISADGHYTDENRIEDATEKIKENLEYLAENTDNLEVKWKGTISKENIKDMVNNEGEIDKFFEYYNKLEKATKEINEDVEFIQASKCPTLVVPGKYNTEDGEYFAKYIRKMIENDYITTYTSRLKRIVNYRDEIDEKPRMFTCSGGDTSVGFDEGTMHICHRTFYFDKENYLESIQEQDEYENWDVSLFEEGILDMVNENYIVENDEEKKRFKYVMRNYHDYWKLKLDQTEAMLIEMARCGQADEIYLKDKKLRQLFAAFINTANSCPIENLLNTGTIHFQPVSMIRLWANGAFQELVKTVGGIDGI